MGLPAELQRAALEDESSWAEDSAFSSPTELPITGRADLSSLERMLQNTNPTRRYMNSGVHDVAMPWAGTIQLEMLLTGLGSTAAGSITTTAMVDVLAWALGNKDLTSEGSTVSTGGWSQPDTGDLDGGTWPAGALMRIGTNDPRDGRGNGQAVPIDSFSGGTLTTLLGFDGAPNASDKAYAMGLIYTDESPPSSSLDGKRLLLATANLQFILRGCFVSGLSFSSFRDGEIPRVTATIGFSYVETTTGEFPGSSQPTWHAGTPIAGGSLAYSEVGDTTRSEVVPRDMSLEIDLQVTPLRGPGGVWGSAQNIVGARRTRATARLSATIDAPAAGSDPWADWYEADPADREWRQFVATLSAADGRAVAICLPRAKPVGRRPTQREFEGLNRQQIQVEGVTTEVSTSALTRSSVRIGIG